MRASLKGNPSTTIISNYTPNDASDETDITTLLNGLYSQVWHIPKHNVQIIGGVIKARIKIINFAYKIC